jgi:hypothetical protein
MKKYISLSAGLLLASLPLATFAHPGHGETDGYTIIHYFVEPAHAVVTVLAVCGALVLGRAVRKHSSDKNA